MAKTEDIAAYIVHKYPHKSELSKARLTKMAYLADWKSVSIRGKQISAIKWYFHNFGPYVDDVAEAARSDPRIEAKFTKNYYGDMKEEFSPVGYCDDFGSLDRKDIDILERIIEETSRLYWSGFIKHVYDTPPIKGSDRYTFLKLEDYV